MAKLNKPITAKMLVDWAREFDPLAPANGAAITYAYEAVEAAVKAGIMNGIDMDAALPQEMFDAFFLVRDEVIPLTIPSGN